MRCLAWFMAFLNRKPENDSVFDEYISIMCPVIPDAFMPGAAAMAVSILADRGESITEGFRRLALWWFRGYENVPGKTREHTEAAIRAAWQGSSMHSPIDYWRRAPAAMFPNKGFHQIMADLQSHFPHSFRSPHDPG